MKNAIVENELTAIRQMLEGNMKNILSFTQTTEYLGISKSHLYSMTSKKLIPHYKPNGKMIYFEKSEIDKWILRNKQLTENDYSELAEHHINNNLITSGR